MTASDPSNTPNGSSGAGRVGVIVVAAGSGSRLGAEEPKAFVPLAGTPLLGHALRGALSCPGVVQVVVVVPTSHLGQSRDLADDELSVCRSADPAAYVTVVPGGAHRGASVAAGLAALDREVEVVLVHDAARCLAPKEVFERVVTALRDGSAAVVPGVAVADTIKQVDGAGHVVATPDRSSLRAVQTPQGFRRDVLERAHAVSGEASDDAGLVERLGVTVLVVEGDPLAFKVTTPADLAAAERILAP